MLALTMVGNVGYPCEEGSNATHFALGCNFTSGDTQVRLRVPKHENCRQGMLKHKNLYFSFDWRSLQSVVSLVHGGIHAYVHQDQQQNVPRRCTAAANHGNVCTLD